MKQSVIAIILVGLLVLLFAYTLQPASATPSEYNTVYMTKGGGSSTRTPLATTTVGVTYLAANASTTFPILTDTSDTIAVDIQMTASTSAGRLVYTYETSNDARPCDTTPTACNWSIPVIATWNYPFATSTTQIASTTPTYVWQPDGALNATSTLRFVITSTDRFVRVKANVSGSAGALWMSATKKSQIQ